MPFDGVTYGMVSLVSPYEYHPDAPSVPGVVGKSIAGAVTYSRTCSAKRIMDQTYRVWQRDPRAYGTNAWGNATTHQDIAEAYNRYIPAHATHVAASVYLLLPGTLGTTTAIARIVLSNGGGTDTGSDDSQEVDLSNHVIMQGSTLGTTYKEMNPEVAIANVDLNDQVNVKVQAYAVDNAGTSGRAFGTSYVCVWWEARG